MASVSKLNRLVTSDHEGEVAEEEEETYQIKSNEINL
jgi:hypothetical protein